MNKKIIGLLLIGCFISSLAFAANDRIIRQAWWEPYWDTLRGNKKVSSWVKTGLNGKYVKKLQSTKTILYALTDDNEIFKANYSDTTFVLPWTQIDNLEWKKSSNNGLSGEKIKDFNIAGNILYAVTSDGLFKSTNGGARWKKVDINVSTDKFTGTNWLTNPNIVLFSNGSDLYLGDGYKVSMSPDAGTSWQEFTLEGWEKEAAKTFCTYYKEIEKNLPAKDLPKDINPESMQEYCYSPESKLFDIKSLAILKDTLYIGTRDHGVLRSIDGGENWEAINNGLPTMHVDILLTVDNLIYAATKKQEQEDKFGSGLYKSVDGGNTWIYAGLENKHIFDLCSVNGVLYASICDANSGTLVEVVKSDDGGNTWIVDLENEIILTFQLADYRLYAGGPDGIFIRQLP